MAAENGADVELQASLKNLGLINEEIDLIVEQLALHAKYELKKAPLYKKRQGVVAEIPKFWLTCAISYLQDIEIQRSAENPINYKVVFVFGENPYFANDKLIKEFDFSDKGNAKVTNHKIDWKSGRDLTAAAKKREAENDGDEFSEDEEASFFSWFDDENGSELADLIANDLFPNAGMYYTGTVSSDDEDEMVPFELASDAEEVSDDEAVEGAPENKRAKRA
ncbi:hypothetical protein LPJ63_003903 [Coemansia sp. RSA 2711]|nr:hypothetical protein LPJ63_003903 [Coemansia sp. RSA 2711]